MDQKKEVDARKNRNPGIEKLCREFVSIYKRKPHFLEIYSQLQTFWDEVHLTINDDADTYLCIASLKPNFINSYAVFIVLFFHLLLEKNLFNYAADLYYHQAEKINNEERFGPLAQDAILIINPQGKKSENSFRPKSALNKRLHGQASISSFTRKIEDVMVLEKFEKAGKRYMRVEALEKIKKEEKNSYSL